MGQGSLCRGLDRASALNYYYREDVNIFKDFVYI